MAERSELAEIDQKAKDFKETCEAMASKLEACNAISERL